MMEHGLVLIDEDGLEREWRMTGLDLTVEFGCLATFDLLLELGNAHPRVLESVEYSDLSHEGCRVLCLRNMCNKLQSKYEPEEMLPALRGQKRLILAVFGLAV